MGIAVPIARPSYNATDNVLLLDETIYSETSTSYVLKTTKDVIETMAIDSHLRIKIWIKKNVAELPGGSCQCRHYDGETGVETVLFTETESGAGYTEYINDIDQELTKGDEIRFYLKADKVPREEFLKDISICGERSPIVES